MGKNNFRVKNERTFKLSKRNRRDTHYITHEYINNAVEKYLETGGKITILEALGTPVTNCNDDTADDFLME